MILLLAIAAAASLAGCGGSSDSSAIGSFSATGGQTATSEYGQLDFSKTLQPQFANGTSSDASRYKLGPTDVLNVAVYQADELNRKVQVSGAGTVTLPLIGAVQAKGRTAHDLEIEIAARLKARYMQAPQVTVFIEEYNSQKVTVSGAVKRPGVFPVKGSYSLMQAIAQAEGLDNVADPTNVIVFREDGANRYVARFNIEQIKSGQGQDLLLQDRDVIVVDSSGIKTAMRDYVQPIAGSLSGLGGTASFVSIVK
jgi:polysaccharide biosynthesis/export protein